MNKEELKKQAFDYNAKLKSHPMSEQDLQDILCDFAEQYAQSQTEALKKEIEELKCSLRDMLELYIKSHEEDEHKQLSLIRSMEILTKAQKILTPPNQ